MTTQSLIYHQVGEKQPPRANFSSDLKFKFLFFEIFEDSLAPS